MAPRGPREVKPDLMAFFAALVKAEPAISANSAARRARDAGYARCGLTHSRNLLQAVRGPSPNKGGGQLKAKVPGRRVWLPGPVLELVERLAANQAEEPADTIERVLVGVAIDRASRTVRP